MGQRKQELCLISIIQNILFNSEGMALLTLINIDKKDALKVIVHRLLKHRFYCWFVSAFNIMDSKNKLGDVSCHSKEVKSAVRLSIYE